ncbi:MAG: hypothetical protein ACRDYF_08810, partial [Acidimicrobiia bacterium]
MAAPNPQQTSIARIARSPGPARSSSTTWPSAWNTPTVTAAEMKSWATWSNLSTPGMSRGERHRDAGDPDDGQPVALGAAHLVA